MIARQWAATSEEEKQLWKERAIAADGDIVDGVEDDVLDHSLAHAADDFDDGKKRARKVMKVSEV